MAVCVKTFYTLIMTTFLATMLALQFLARHGCVCQNALYPHHDYISGHDLGLPFSCQDMTVCVKTLYTIIMTTFLATMSALHFLARHGCLCQNTSYPHHDYISGHHVGLTISYQDIAVRLKTLYTLIMTAFLATMFALHFLTKTWLCV